MIPKFWLKPVNATESLWSFLKLVDWRKDSVEVISYFRQRNRNHLGKNNQDENFSLTYFLLKHCFWSAWLREGRLTFFAESVCSVRYKLHSWAFSRKPEVLHLRESRTLEPLTEKQKKKDTTTSGLWAVCFTMLLCSLPSEVKVAWTRLKKLSSSKAIPSLLCHKLNR